ncbi:hypothetical protein L210DRAFT_3643388 [Boletus edulis BED1]|uniref:Uncharacterized protein n=1 Tax=Boletus edulis BED1 TaxID=1328754 RepID=A0AAD4BZ40_BOLED|nr:hypothetical protein L210DRAFT_3643388 [Boletus edulis BED1]
MTQKRKSAPATPANPPAAAQDSEETSQPTPSTSHAAREDSNLASSSTPCSSHDEVRFRLQAPSVTAKYAGTCNLSQNMEFKPANLVAHNDFFLSPDGNYDPENALGTRFQDVKLNCHIIPPVSSAYSFAIDDFIPCINNLRAFERLLKHDRGESVGGMVHGSILGTTQVKVTHALFEPRLTPLGTDSSDDNEETDATNQDANTICSETYGELGPEFAMETWPVAPRCIDSLQELISTHDICPLPAFDMHGDIIPPTRYESLLKGATVEVHFAVVHHHIKRKKKHVYNAVLHKMQILQLADPAPSSPFKRLRVSSARGKGKACTL